VRDPLQRLQHALRARLTFLLSRDAAQVLLYDWRALKGRARQEMIELRDRYEAFWTGLLHDAAATGRLRADIDLRMLRFLVLGALNGVPLWYSDRGARTPDEIADAFFALIAYGVLDEAQRPSDVETALRALSALEPAGVGGR
jgi:TetR/AcrR family transcriptional regulator, cholesterol catabolism regulator